MAGGMAKDATGERSRALILRAEVVSDGVRIVTHTVDVAETAVTLACDAMLTLVGPDGTREVTAADRCL